MGLVVILFALVLILAGFFDPKGLEWPQVMARDLSFSIFHQD